MSEKGKTKNWMSIHTQWIKITSEVVVLLSISMNLESFLKYSLMYGSCHFNRASNDKFSVEFLCMFDFFSVDIRSQKSPIHSKLSLLS